jgi:hypothetical protein
MYPQNIDGQPSASAPPASGVASRVAQLQKSVQSLQSLTYQAKTALGLGTPEAEAKNVQPPSSLAEVLTDLRCRVDQTCMDIEAMIQHLNS